VTERVPGWVVQVIGQLERHPPARLDKYYTMAIDYLFWYGALGALREQRSAAPPSAPTLGAQPASRRAGQA
jgi:hypothetical protein